MIAASLRNVLIMFLLIAQFASAQEEAVVPESLELPADIAAQFDARIEAIETQGRAVARLRHSFESSEGLEVEIYGGRMDAVWSEMFDDTIRFAQDVATRQADGFPVSKYAAFIAERLIVFPQESAAVLERLRHDVIHH